MSKRAIVAFVFLLAVCVAGARNLRANRSEMQVPHDDQAQPSPAYVPPGRQMFKEYCAACHGLDGKGRGPVAASLRKPPPDLTTLAKRHGGSFPEEYVTQLLHFGPGFLSHGSSEMPVWGPIFRDFENYNEAAVRKRIQNLCDYLESIQEK
jgi:mono/diheme cytochrome c family protein